MARTLDEIKELGRNALAEVLNEFPEISEEDIDDSIQEIAKELTPADAQTLIQIMLIDMQLFYVKVDGLSALDLIRKCMLREIVAYLTKEVFIDDTEDD